MSYPVGQRPRFSLRLALLAGVLVGALGFSAVGHSSSVAAASDSSRAVKGTPGDDLIIADPAAETIEGRGGDDVIYVDAGARRVDAGPGDDVIYGGPKAFGPTGTELRGLNASSTSFGSRGGSVSRNLFLLTPITCSANPCLGGNGGQLLKGGTGNDQIFAQRGDDELLGEGGEDALFGGTGNDAMHGGTGNDFLFGGPGIDTIYGDANNDLVRGDGTIDFMYGGEGNDTVSFSTGVTPGNESAYPTSVKHVEGFPEATSGDGRGVYVRIDGAATTCGGPPYSACDSGAAVGGGSDYIATSEFENIIGSAFPDIIVGASGANKLYGGGGGDVIVGGGGADTIYGGGDGDYIEGSSSAMAYGGKGSNNCVGVTVVKQCTGTSAKTVQPPAAKLVAGVLMTESPLGGYDAAYLLGSESADEVTAAVSGSVVKFTSKGTTRFATESEGCLIELEATVASCTLPTGAKLDAVVLAGLKGNDNLSIANGGFGLATAPILLGGEGGDVLTGGNGTEDALVDGNGTGADKLNALGGDDWLANNQGLDLLEGGRDNDTFLSVTTCDGDTIFGAEDEAADGFARNEASWEKLPAALGGVTAYLETQSAGSYYDSVLEEPACASGTPTTLIGLDDLKGSFQADNLHGGAGANLISGETAKDSLFGEAGNDEIAAKDTYNLSPQPEKDVVGGGEGQDRCAVDSALDEWTGCEFVE